MRDRFPQKLIWYVTHIGANPSDNDDIRLQKALLVSHH